MLLNPVIGIRLVADLHISVAVYGVAGCWLDGSPVPLAEPSAP